MRLILKLVCRIVGHSKEIPILEAWASKMGKKKSYYLCRRCLDPIGEKYYG